MRKTTIPYLVFASLYFVLALFTILMLALTSFSEEFRQMFRLTTQPFGVYFQLSIILLISGVFVAVFNGVRIYMSHIPKVYSWVVGIGFCVFLGLLYAELFLLNRTMLDYFSLKDTILLEKDKMFYKNIYQIIIDYTFYLFLILIPLSVYFLNLSFNKNLIFGRILHLTQPRFNTIICALFGFAITPFFKNGIHGYIDFCLLLLGLILVGYFCIKGHRDIDSYEYFNAFLLVVVSLIVVCGSFEFTDAESYFEVRKVFYMLALFGWCNCWMMQLTTKRKA